MNIFTKAAVGLTFSLMASTPADAHLYVVILTDHHKKGTERAGLTLGELAKSKLVPGDILVVMDGTKAEEIATIEIPNKQRYNNPKFLLKYLKKNYRKIAAYQKEQKSKATVSESNDIAGLLRELGDGVLSTYPDETSEIIIFADPIHHDPRRPTSSMRGARYFNDGHIRATSQQSDFGVADRANHFQNAKVHMCVSTDVRFQTNRYEEIVERGWSLYISEKSGTLATFTQDTQLCVRRFLKSSNPARSFSLKPDEQNPVMVHLLPPKPKPAPVAAPEPATEDDDKPAVTAPVQPESAKRDVSGVSETPSGFLQSNVHVNQGAALNTKGRLKVGIRWRCACDLDLYVQHRSERLPLSFRNKSSAMGKFHKDLMSSRDSDRAYEFVEFTKPVDAKDLDIKVNFYGGSASGGARGDVRIWLEGQEGVWEVPFHIEASSGNSGNRSSGSKHWVTLDPMTILGLRK